MTASEMVAKIETQLRRGLITPQEYASELLAVAMGEGQAMIEAHNATCHIVATMVCGGESETRYFNSTDDMTSWYCEWNREMTDVVDVVTPNNAVLSVGYNWQKMLPSTFLTEDRCVRIANVDCGCMECNE
jgi:hypothetical protein